MSDTKKLPIYSSTPIAALGEASSILCAISALMRGQKDLDAFSIDDGQSVLGLSLILEQTSNVMKNAADELDHQQALRMGLRKSENDEGYMPIN